jgi:hypothetical protein
MMNFLGISAVELEIEFRLFQQNIWEYRYGRDKGCCAIDRRQHFGGSCWLCVQPRSRLQL